MYTNFILFYRQNIFANNPQVITANNTSYIIKDSRHQQASDVRFIRRQANEVAHSLARVAPCHASFRIFIRIPFCISTLFLNEMH